MQTAEIKTNPINNNTNNYIAKIVTTSTENGNNKYQTVV
jgi:hypothetical protein